MLVIVCCEHKHRLLRAYHCFAPMLGLVCCEGRFVELRCMQRQTATNTTKAANPIGLQPLFIDWLIYYSETFFTT